MSRMAELHLKLSEGAVSYLTSQGIDEDLIWQACNTNHDRVIALAEQHKAANGHITDVTTQALTALAVIDRFMKEFA